MLLAIDAGDHGTGLAAFVDQGAGCGIYGGYDFVGCMTTEPVTSEADARAELLALTSGLGLLLPGRGVEWTVVVERDTNPNNRVAIESLAANRRIWRNVCLDHGVPAGRLFEVAPQTWQGPCGLLSKTARVMGGTKHASMSIAAQQFGIEPRSDDEADAALMGAWWLRAGGEAGAAARGAKSKADKAKRKNRGGWTPEVMESLRARGIVG